MTGAGGLPPDLIADAADTVVHPGGAPRDKRARHPLPLCEPGSELAKLRGEVGADEEEVRGSAVLWHSQPECQGS